MAKNNQEQTLSQKMSGSLILWVVITIIFMIFSLGGNNIANPIEWIMLICLITSLVMVFNRKGSRWFTIIISIIFGALFLHTACTVTGYSLCAANWKSCIVTDMKVWNQAADVARIGGFIIAGYMFYTSIFFILSNSVKMRFDKTRYISNNSSKVKPQHSSVDTKMEPESKPEEDDEEDDF